MMGWAGVVVVRCVCVCVFLMPRELQTASGRVCACESQQHSQLGQPDSIPTSVQVKLLGPTGLALSPSAPAPTHHFLSDLQVWEHGFASDSLHINFPSLPARLSTREGRR